MRTIRYDGPFRAVEVPAAGVVVQRGETVEVEPEVAASLLRQKDNWSKVTKPAKAEKKEATDGS